MAVLNHRANSASKFLEAKRSFGSCQVTARHKNYPMMHAEMKHFATKWTISHLDNYLSISQSRKIVPYFSNAGSGPG